MSEACSGCEINDLKEPIDQEYWKRGDPLVCYACQEEPRDCDCCRHCGGER